MSDKMHRTILFFKYSFAQEFIAVCHWISVFVFLIPIVFKKFYSSLYHTNQKLLSLYNFEIE